MPHEITRECAPMHCHWHEVDEPEEGAYGVCQECGHVYQTEQDLRDAYAESADWPGESTDSAPEANEIYFCPLCIHDF